MRPEKVRIHRDRPSGLGNDMRATVRDVSFTGVATQYLVTVASGATWSVYEQNLDVEPIDLHPGDEVWMSWEPGHAFGVPAEGAEIPDGPVLADVAIQSSVAPQDSP